MTLKAGSRLGPYKVVAPLGAGGMGEVYRARDTKLERDVAVKVLPERFASDPERVARFRHEAQHLAALNHPNIVSIYGVEDTNTRVALVMELVEGTSLNDQVGPKGMPLAAALKLAVQIASGLEAAHSVGIVHRDLKPANVIVTSTGVVKLVDFGLAKQEEAATPGSGESETVASSLKTKHGEVLGTVAYMSPEQAQGQTIDVRSDLFSFGTLLYEMLTGRRPFQGENHIATLAAILEHHPIPPSEIARAPLPREVERLVLRCLRKDPDRRYQTASDLRLALEDLKEDASTGRLEPVAEVSATRNSRWRWAVIMGLCMAGIAAVGFWMLWPKSSTPHLSRQLTFDVGIAQTPALSPDGKLLAYASDRGGNGQFDIWLKQLAGGEPIRLTSGPTSKTDPQFSSDGTKIYYLSAGSIFEVPSLGGSSRKLIERAGPFSVSNRGEIGFVNLTTGSNPGPITIVPADGGAPEAWQPSCRSWTPPVWSPGGDRVVIAGFCGAVPNLRDLLRPALLVAPRHGGSIQQIAVWDLPSANPRLAWFRLQDGSEGLVLPMRTGDSINLHRMDLNGRRSLITQRTGLEMSPAVSQTGRLIFSRAEQTPAILSLGLEGGERPTVEVAPGRLFGTSRDGRTLVYGLWLANSQLCCKHPERIRVPVIWPEPVSGPGSLRR